jgi:hypothetical protein
MTDTQKLHEWLDSMEMVGDGEYCERDYERFISIRKKLLDACEEIKNECCVCSVRQAKIARKAIEDCAREIEG